MKNPLDSPNTTHKVYSMCRYYVYILASKRNGTLYTGVTNNLLRRVEQHKKHEFDGFTAEYEVMMLVWYQDFPDITCAIAMEKRIKRWRRKWKLQMIDSFNPDWRDLSESLVDEG